jgi:KaiC/GvpD/RAD55 family RecA-like ATPase
MRKITAENLLISRILVDRDINTPVEEGIQARHFAAEETREAWIWISLYRSEYVAVPTVDTFRRQFPNFAIDQTPDDPMRALIDEVYGNYKKRLTSEGLIASITEYEETNDVDTTLAIITKFVHTIHSDTARSDVQLASDIVGKLVVQYVNAEENSMPGIPTGFDLIDEALGGLQDEQLITIIGLPKRMKSSYLLAMAANAMMYGARVGIVSFEMSNAEQQARWMSLGAHVNLTRMQRGLLTEHEQNKLYQFESDITETPGLGDMLFVHDVDRSSTVDGLVAQHEKYGFDVLFVDGVYLMDDSHGEPKGSSQALTNITRGLKRFAQNAKIPIVCTTQALFSRTSKARGIEMESIAYTSSFAQDSDVLIGIDRLDMELPVSKLKIIAARNALGMECEVAIDYEKGEVEDRGYVTSDFGQGSAVGGIEFGGADS